MLSLVIPIYNEAENIPYLIEKLDNLCKIWTFTTFEIILVDDCSQDETPALIQKYIECKDNYRYIRLAKNKGSHIAIIAGLQFAKGDCMVFLAADLQDPPELIESMYERWQQGYQVVWAVRDDIQGVEKSAKLFSKFFYKIFNTFTNLDMPPKGADFVLFDKKVRDALLLSVGSRPILTPLIISLGFKQTFVSYVKQSRKFGKSKWTTIKKINAFIDAFVGFSVLPLRLISVMGFIVASIGFIYAAILVFLKIYKNTSILGWTSTMVVTLCIGGFQMIMLGVIGEYLWRNLEES